MKWKSATPLIQPEPAKMRAMVEAEIDETRAELRTLNSCYPGLRKSELIIALVILLNIVMLHFIPKYALMWIIATFVLLIVNPLILMIPTQRPRKLLPDQGGRQQISGILSQVGVAATTIKGQKKVFGEFIWNVFFINCHPMAPGIIFIFALDILYSLISLAQPEMLRSNDAPLIIIQAAVIIIFYAMIWYMQPYSPEFFSRVYGLDRRTHERMKSGLRPALKLIFVIAMAAAATGILFIGALLMPGFTLQQVFSIEQVQISWGLIPFLVIFASQVIVVRYLQGAYSRDLLVGLSGERLRVLEEELLPGVTALAAAEEAGEPADPEELKQLTTELLKLKVYKSDYQDLFGLFPVFMMVPDIPFLLGLGEGAEAEETPR